MRIENWCGHDIRFVEIDGHWYAILKDICDALKLKTWHISERLDPSMLEKVLVETSDLTSVETMSNTHEPVKKINKAMIGNDISRKRGERKTMWMLVLWLELEQIDYVDEADLQLWNLLAENGNCSKGFECRSLTCAGEYDVRLLSLVV